MVAPNKELETLIEHVKAWPIEARITLARRVLETLESQANGDRRVEKGLPSSQLLGLWNPTGMILTDEDCDVILADELRRKLD